MLTLQCLISTIRPRQVSPPLTTDVMPLHNASYDSVPFSLPAQHTPEDLLVPFKLHLEKLKAGASLSAQRSCVQRNYEQKRLILVP
jgi:hypothetical protein